jgi:hypothetical protein
MTKAELITEFRKIVRDWVVPYKWSDVRVALWLSEAQDRFCERTGFWADKSTYSLTTVLGQQEYVIDSRVISVKSLWVDSQRLIEVSGDPNTNDSDFADTTPQTPASYRLDLSTGFITFVGPVVAGIVVSLRVHRKSKVALSAASGQPEIMEEFQLALPEYAAYKAYGDHDQTTQDPVKADEHLKNFKIYTKDGARAYRRLTGDYLTIAPNPLYVV